LSEILGGSVETYLGTVEFMRYNSV